MTPLQTTLYQVNARLLLGEVGPRATLDDVPDALLDKLAGQGVDILYLLGVWQTGPAGRAVSRGNRGWWPGYDRDLPGWTEADVRGSPFAVQAYVAHSDFGGDPALSRLRQRLRQRGLRLLLDLVPNHTALDHPWVQAHPEFYVHGSEADLRREPHNYVRVETGRGTVILAHGRDPYFPGWPDTLQLNYRHPELRAAMRSELRRIASRCDGVRCDMAMLLLPDVFEWAWGERSLPADGTAPDDSPFWPLAIQGAQALQSFLFVAEAYWDREWDLLQQGFDLAYDKRLYDRLREGGAAGVRAHLGAGLDFQRRCVRFLENHDELRAAAVFPPGRHQAAAVLAYCTPGLRFFHDGQWEGRRVHASVHLARRAAEAPDPTVLAFYDRLLACLRRPELRTGAWQPRTCRPAWPGNGTADNFIAFTWTGSAGELLLGAVNYAPAQGQCYVELPLPELRGRRLVLRDLLGEASYERDGADLAGRGLYLDVPGWGHHLFAVTDR
jgi:hypothetical protein